MDDQDQREHAPFRFTDSRQRRIHRRLELIGPGPAAFYRDVCRFLAGAHTVESTTHLVAHLLREIESAIRDVLVPQSYRPPKDKKGPFKAEIDAILSAYGIAASDPVAVAWRGLPDREDERWLGRFAHRSSLAAPRRLDEEFRTFCEEVEAILDVILERFEGQFTESFKVLDALTVKAAPTREDVKTLRGRVPNNLVTLDYFFSKAEAARWLELLASEGFFRRPPEPVRDDEKGFLRFPPWPESRYLARMAARPEAQERVVEIALAIPDTTNILVHEDLVRLALAVPAPLAARLMPRIRQWVRSPYQLRLLHRIGDLVRHLASGGEIDAALELAAVFLTILPDPDVKEVSVGDQTWRLAPHPRTEHDDWLVEEFLRETFPALVDVSGGRALAVACKALDDAVRLSRTHPEDEGPQDYSTIWRPAIEGHEDNELKSTLVTAVRRTAERLIELEPARVADIIGALEAHRWTIFSRVALHALKDVPGVALSVVEDRLRQKERFADRSQKREYMQLAQTWFSRLSPDTQQKILRWIAEGPDLEALRQVRREMGGQEPRDEELAEYADRWRLQHLRALRDLLPAESRERYRALVACYGEPEAPDFLTVPSGSVKTGGPKSPITLAELRQTSITDLVQRLKTWQPSGEFLGPSPEGLSRALASAVEEAPVRFASDAERFSEVEPTYVRGVITGLRNASEKERPFDWVPVLRLCQWVVSQPIGPDEGGGPFERDRGWRWTRKAIVDLLEEGLRSGPCQLPFELRELVWTVLRPLTDDPDPRPKDAPDPEPLTTAINTTRGAAMEALVKHALWVKENLGRVADAAPTEDVTLQQMSEVRDVLDLHLDPIRDPSPAIRAVYGRWLPWLVHLDREWVEAQLPRIFPTDDRLARLRDAAWDTYVVFCPLDDNVGEVLKDEYSRAAERMDQPEKGDERRADPASHLAEHLMVLYWRGKYELEGRELAQFYANAVDEVCGHAMWFVGRVFAKEAGEPPAEMVDRVKRLFEIRLAVLRKAPDRHRKELERFGSWFAAGRFGEEWSLATLQETLKLVGRAQPDSLVMEELVRLAPLLASEVVECLRLMVEGAEEHWKIEAWRTDIRRIVTTALQVGGPAREAAVTLVNILVARGHVPFRDLLGQ